MQWTSPEQIVSQLGLNPSGNSREEILACVRQEMAIIHPDKSNGVFKSTHDEERWHKLTSAKEYLEDSSQRTLEVIPASQLLEVIRSIREISVTPASNRVSQFLVESSSSIRRQAFFPKLTSGILAGVCGFLVSLSGVLKDNPILGPLLSLRPVQLLLVDLMIISAFLCAFFWFREGQRERYVEWLLTNSGIKSTLCRALDTAFYEDDKQVFRFHDFVRCIYSDCPNDKKSQIFFKIAPYFLATSKQIDGVLAERTGNLMIDKLKEDNIIVELPRLGFDRRFGIKQDVAFQIRYVENL